MLAQEAIEAESKEKPRLLNEKTKRERERERKKRQTNKTVKVIKINNIQLQKIK